MVVQIVAAIFGLFVFALFPTVTYLYVEKRARRHWLDVAGGRAPTVVRAASWGSLALGQMCVLWLILPAVCGGLVFTLSKIRHGGTFGYAFIVLLGVVALLQAIAALGLVPFGIRLLARNSNSRKNAGKIALVLGLVNLAALALAGGTYAMMLFSNAFHPIIKIALVFGVALPIGIYAGLSLVLALLVSRATANAMPPSSEPRA